MSQTPTLEGFERQAKRDGSCSLFITIDRDDFCITCRWPADEAAPRWYVDDISTPIGQVAALLENAALHEQAKAIDWNAPIEAFDDDGRVVPLTLDPTGFIGENPDQDGDYWTQGNQTGCECWGPDGSGYTNWTVRNVAQVSL